MAKQNINVGTAANDKKGDSLRAAFQKVNANFTELYTELGLVVDANLNLGAFEFAGSTLSTTDSTAIVIDQATTVTSNLSVGGDILPQTALGGNLGSSTLPWRSLYVSNNTIFLGGVPLGIDANGNLTVNGSQIAGGGGGSSLVNGANTLSLGSDGVLTLPGGRTRIGAIVDSDAIIANEDEAFGVVAQGTNGAVQLVWVEDLENAYTSNIAAVYVNSGNLGSVRIATGVNSGPGPNYWEFGADGNLTVPSNIGSTQASGLTVGSNYDVRIVADQTDNNHTWTFNGIDGSLRFPGESIYKIEESETGLAVTSERDFGIFTNSIESVNIWTFDTNGATTFPGNIIVPGNLSTIAGFAFYNGDPISIVATATVWALSFANPYYIEIAKTGLPAGFDALLGSGTWTVTANASTFTVVSVVTNGDYWRITVAENPSSTISTIATFNRAASGANIVIPSSGSITFANGVNILSTVGTYSNTNVASYLLQFDGDIEFTSSTAKIGNVDVVTVGDHIRSPSYQFSNGASILANVATKVTSSWTVTTGTNTYSFTVPESGTYLLWVIGNIPNGIIAWNATATITNSNVPVVGAQYAWVYDGAGTPIDFTSIPNQFTGTGNTIVRSSSSPSATTNRFDFGINNTSGGAVTVTYGYTKL